MRARVIDFLNHIRYVDTFNFSFNQYINKVSKALNMRKGNMTCMKNIVDSYIYTSNF